MLVHAAHGSRMLDLGFEKDLRTIARSLPEHQTLLYTATWPTSVQRVAAALLRPMHVKVVVGGSGGRLVANPSVAQRVHVVAPKEKWSALFELLSRFAPGGELHGTSVFVFANTKRDVNAIGSHCAEAGMASDIVSGDRTQEEREHAVRQFREGAVRVLVATDVASRGLDVQGVERVCDEPWPRTWAVCSGEGERNPAHRSLLVWQGQFRLFIAGGLRAPHWADRPRGRCRSGRHVLHTQGGAPREGAGAAALPLKSRTLA